MSADEAQEHLTAIARQIRGVLTGLGLCFESERAGYVQEIAFSDLRILSDGGGNPVLGLVVVDTRPGAFPPRVDIGRLSSDEVLNHLSEAVGRPVFLKRDDGLAYAVLLNTPGE